MQIENDEYFEPEGIAFKVHYAAKRFTRMARLFLARRITWESFKLSQRTSQKAVCLIGGGMVFCDYADEAAYLGYE